ncbi:MAG: phosphomannomutase [Gammaproteobacteria bacterium]|nr:phosphomannomutase [Gammaproteobacteria bacterium]
MSNTPATVRINELMEISGVKFGTSGARGLVSDMNDRICYAYTAAFLQYLKKIGELASGQTVGLAHDFRPSSPAIMRACCQAIVDDGYTPLNGGCVPTPAIAHYGMRHNIPTLMVTGSHIPDDRNGIKFYRPGGEILKADEQSIREQSINLSPERFDLQGSLLHPTPVPAIDDTVHREYVKRFTDFFPPHALRGMTVAVYQHSSVASRSLLEVIAALGATAIPLGHSASFIPVDTEAVRQEDIALAAQWAGEFLYDAIVSTDGDGDRPLIGDEHGNWLRGDIVGILCARYLSADVVVTPISSNTAVEKSELFTQVIRTRIGSPYVINAMQRAADQEPHTIVGYEANGGFLTQSNATLLGKTLSPLPTRDALLPILAILHLTTLKQCKVSSLVNELPARFSHSDRIKGVPTGLSLKRLATLAQSNAREFIAQLAEQYHGEIGTMQNLDTTDGLRVTLSSGNIFHLRPSGNAPELRCYTEADSEETAQQLNQACIEVMRGWQ